MLTGTPIMNRPSELTSLLEILGHLNSFGGWFPFVQRYCGAFQRRIPRKTAKGVIWMKVWDVSGARHLTELNQRLTDTCLIRRMKKDVLKELPSKFRCRVVFPIDNRPEYDRAKANLAAYCAAAAVSNKAFIELCKTLPVDKRKQAIEERKIEAAGSAERAEQLVLIETLKQITTRGKMAGIIEWVENFLETDQKLVVFAMHIEAQESLYRRFKGAARIVASDSHLVRQSNIDKFIKDAGCRLLVCSLLAGGTGVDGLQEVCNNVAFIELPWTPAQALQAEDRVQRIGQTDQVTAWYLLAENTIEEEIQAMLAAKQAVCDSVLDGSEVRDGSIFNELIDIMSGAPDAEKAL
jgi:SWI/SNF-related matrix-associated actin-dependent regulator of chromatin subfamily A-like protein 1